MNQTLPICCFCEKVRDDAGVVSGEGLWQDVKIYMAVRGLRPRNTVFAYGCCPRCLAEDPRAIAFRTRGSQSASPLRYQTESSKFIDQHP